MTTNENITDIITQMYPEHCFILIGGDQGADPGIASNLPVQYTIDTLRHIANKLETETREIDLLPS